MSEIARELLKIIGQAGTMEILEYLCEHGTAPGIKCIYQHAHVKCTIAPVDKARIN